MTTNRAYPGGLTDIWDGTIDLVADDLSLQLVDETFTFVSTHQYLSEVPTGEKLGSRTAVSGTRSYASATLVTNASATTITAVSAVDDVGGVLLVGPGATDAARRLIYCWRRTAAPAPIVVVTDGGDIQVAFQNGTILTLTG